MEIQDTTFVHLTEAEVAEAISLWLTAKGLGVVARKKVSPQISESAGHWLKVEVEPHPDNRP